MIPWVLWLLVATPSVDRLEAFGDWALLLHQGTDLEVVDTLGRTLWWQRVPDLVDVEGGPLAFYLLRSDRLEVHGADGTRVGEVPVEARACAVVADGTVFLLSPEGTEILQLKGQQTEPVMSLPRPAVRLDGAGLALAVRFPDSLWLMSPEGEVWWRGSARVAKAFAQGQHTLWILRGDTLYLPSGPALPRVTHFDLAPTPDLRLWWMDRRGTLRTLRAAGFPEPGRP